eukprot:12930332-Prorocentrum_lima.AAC.1
MRKVLHAAEELGPSLWQYAAMDVADVMRHNSTGRLWSPPAFGKVVAVTRPGPKNALEPRAQVGHYLHSQSWTNEVTYVW